jgi:hypothetical protein
MPLRYLVVALAAVTLAGCSDYPADYPPLDRGLWRRVVGGCPDISGTFALTAPQSTTERPGAFRETFLRQATSLGDPRFPWETITIAGDASDSLVLTVSRSDSGLAAYRAFAVENSLDSYREWTVLQDPAVRHSGQFARMSDSAYAANLAHLTLPRREQVVVHHGVEYDCDAGWVRSARFMADAAPGWRAPLPDDGDVRLARSLDGGLVGQATMSATTTISLWCGDGCKAASLGTGTVTRWARLRPGEPGTLSPEARPWAVPRPDTTEGVALQPPESVPSAPSSGISIEVLQERVTSHLPPPGLTVTDVRVDGNAVQVSAQCRTRALIAQYMRTLNADPLLTPTLIEIVQRNDGELVAVVRVQRR